MKFPLPLGHKFGPRALALDLRFHPADEPAESAALYQWQHQVMLHWVPGLKPNGVYDGDTQRAVIEIQRVSGLYLTGCLDQETWDATFSRPSDAVAPETALESTESDENAEGVPQGTPEEEPAQIGAEAVVPVESVKRGPGRPPKR